MTFAFGIWLILGGPWFRNKTHIALYCWNISVSLGLYYHRRNRSHRSVNSRRALKALEPGLNAPRPFVNTGIKWNVNVDINKAQNNCIKDVLFALTASWHTVSWNRSPAFVILCLSQLNPDRSSSYVHPVLHSVLHWVTFQALTTYGWPFVVSPSTYKWNNMDPVQFQQL
jgi:hypothetical protein